MNEPAGLDHQRSIQYRGHALGGRRGHRRGLGGDRRSLRAVSFQRRRAGKNLAGDSAALGHHQLGSTGTRSGCAWIRAPSAFSWACPSRPATQPNRVLALDYRCFAHSFGDRYVCVGAEQLHDRADDLRQPGAQVGALAHRLPMPPRSPSAATARRSFLSATARATEKSTSSVTRSFPTTARPSPVTTRRISFPARIRTTSSRVRSHRKLFSYLTCYAKGQGT